MRLINLLDNTPINLLNLHQNNSETVINEHDKEILKERHICIKEKDKTLLII